MVRDMRRKTVANVFFFVTEAPWSPLFFEEVTAEEAAAVANPAADMSVLVRSRRLCRRLVNGHGDFISKGDDACAVTVLKAQSAVDSRRPAAAGLDDGEQKKMMEEVLGVAGQAAGADRGGGGGGGPGR